jgi:hypothetical protein
MVAVTLFVDPRIALDVTFQQILWEKAREVTNAWIMVFLDSSCSKTILVGTKETPDEKHKKRARWMLETLGKTLPKFLDRPVMVVEGVEVVSEIEAMLHGVAGMIQHRMEEFNIQLEKTAVQIMKLKGQRRAMYLACYLPLAKGTMEKGKPLTDAEGENIRRGRSWNGM